MKYYEHNRAFDRIVAASNMPDEDQLLFLVPDEGNKFDTNAVSLHDGVRKLGHVSAREAPMIRKFIDRLSREKGQDQVLVVKARQIANKDSFKWSTSFNVSCIGVVYERIARKHAEQVHS